jgi:hypothetical protein
MLNTPRFTAAVSRPQAAPASPASSGPGTSSSAGVSSALPAPTRIDNASASMPLPSLPRRSVFDTLCDAIAAGDAQLCRWMAQGHQAEVEDNTMLARDLISSLETQRVALARYTARQLVAWLGPKGVKVFELTTRMLITRIQHAGLDRILTQLKTELPPHGKAVRIGRLLCDAGARPEPVREALQLTLKELRGTKATLLMQLLLPQETADRLQLVALSANPMTAAHEALDPHRADLRCERAEAWQHAAMVNRRFGYDTAHPAWKFMRAGRSNRDLIKLLDILSHTPETKRRGIEVQLP